MILTGANQQRRCPDIGQFGGGPLLLPDHPTYSTREKEEVPTITSSQPEPTMGNLLYLVPEEAPVWQPTHVPTLVPSASPLVALGVTSIPTAWPSLEPSTRLPTLLPSVSPSQRPSAVPISTTSVAPTEEVVVPEDVGFRYVTEQTCSLQESNDIQDYLNAMAEELRRRRELFYGRGVCLLYCSGYPPGTCYQFHLSCYYYRRSLEALADRGQLSLDLNHRPPEEEVVDNALETLASQQMVVPAGGHVYGRKMQTVEECELYNAAAQSVLGSVIANVTLTTGCISGLQQAHIDCFPVS